MRPHQNLDLWKRSIELAVSVYRQTETFRRRKNSINPAITSCRRIGGLECSRRSSSIFYKEFRKFLAYSQGR